MKDNMVKIGMMVTPHDKTVPGYRDLDESASWKRGKSQGFLYVTGWDDEENCWILDDELNSYGGDFFNASDFQPYENANILLLLDEAQKRLKEIEAILKARLA